MKTTRHFRIGAQAGWGFAPGDNSADLTVYYHCTVRRNRTKLTGFYVVRKWLENRAAYDYDHRLGWCYDRWFEFPADEEAESDK